MGGERGFTTVQYVVATACSLMLFVLTANLLVDMYARGAVRDALDEGVRAAVPIGAAPGVCEARAHEVVRSIAAGSLVHVDDLGCARNGPYVVAHARVTLRSWVPMLVGDWHLDLRAAALPER